MKTIDMDATGLAIHRFMEAKNTSVKDLQDLFGFGTPQSVYKWINGKTIPTIDHLVTLSEYFGVAIDDIIIRKEI